MKLCKKINLESRRRMYITTDIINGIYISVNFEKHNNFRDRPTSSD